MDTASIVRFHLDLVEDIYRNYIAELGKESNETLQMALLDLRKGTRWYQISTDHQIATIWEDIRRNEHLLDYIMHGTSELILRGMKNDAEARLLFESVAASWTWSSHRLSVESDLAQRSPTNTFISNRVERDVWLLFVYLHTFVRQVS